MTRHQDSDLLAQRHLRALLHCGLRGRGLEGRAPGSYPWGGMTQHLGDRFSEEVERQAGDDDGDPGCQRRGGVDVDAAQAQPEQPAPVVGGWLDAEAEEGQAGEGEQGVAGGDGRVDHERLADVRQDVAEQQPDPAHAGDAGGGDEVLPRDFRGQGLGEPGEPGRDGEADREQGPGRADAEDDGEEQGQQQPGERHRQVHRGRDPPAGTNPEHHRRQSQQEPDRHAGAGGRERQQHREPGCHQDPEEDVPTQVVGAGPVGGRGTLQDLAGVHGLGPLAPEQRRDQRQHQDHREQRGRARPDRGAQRAGPHATRH